MVIIKDFAPHEQSLDLKQLGFDEPCLAKYINKQFSMNVEGEWYKHNSNEITNGWISAPQYQQCFRWFEDNQSMFVERIITTNANEIMDIEYNIKSWRFPTVTIEFDDPYDSFDKNKAELACLTKLIEIVKTK
jgi:hypothetical protein